MIGNRVFKLTPLKLKVSKYYLKYASNKTKSITEPSDELKADYLKE